MDNIASLLFPLLILLLFIPIFLSSRRQRKQVAEMQALQASLEPGDVVVTTSGLRATVVDASYEETIDLEIADDVVTTWVRAAIREKVDPVADDAAGPTAGTETADDRRVDDDEVSLEKTPLEKTPLEKSAHDTGESTNGAAHN